MQPASQPPSSPPGRGSFTDILLDQAGLSIDRLPMLPVVFDRVAGQCSDGLRHWSTTSAFFQVTSISAGRIGDMLDAKMGSVAAVYHCRELDSKILIGVDRACIATLVETLFGGDGSEPPSGDERPPSTIELRLAQLLFDQGAIALQAALAPMTQVTFKLERVETRIDFAVIGRRNTNAVLARIGLQALERGGELFVMVPEKALNPIRQNLARDLGGEASARDPRWTRQMESEVGRTEVTLRAVIEENDLTLGDVANLRVGQVLKLKATPQTPVKFQANDHSLFLCQLGQADGHYTVRIESSVDLQQEFMDDILSR